MGQKCSSLCTSSRRNRVSPQDTTQTKADGSSSLTSVASVNHEASKRSGGGATPEVGPGTPAVNSPTNRNKDHPILFRKYVSRKVAGKGRAVLEGVGLDSETIAACFNSHPLNEEEAVQAGLTKWCGGQGNEPPTWQVLFAAMQYAQIAQQHVHNLKKELGQFEHITEQQKAVTEGVDKSPKSAVQGQVTGGQTADTRGSQPPTQVVAVSPVIVAAESGQLSMVRKLLDGKAVTVEDQDERGRTALLAASSGGHLSVVKELVNVYNVELCQKDEHGKNAMHCAAQGGHIEVIKFLLPLFGEGVHEKANAFYTMLHWAAQNGHCQVARYLIEEIKMKPKDRDNVRGYRRPVLVSKYKV